MQIRKRNQLMVGATALGALVATATTAHAEETNRRVEKIPSQTKTQMIRRFQKVNARSFKKVWKVKKKL